jgi:hypothetical protein
MTKENRERQYKNFRDGEKNYICPPGKGGLFSTSRVRARFKLCADKMLKVRPELSALDPQAEPSPKPKPKKKEVQDEKPKG